MLFLQNRMTLPTEKKKSNGTERPSHSFRCSNPISNRKTTLKEPRIHAPCRRVFDPPCLHHVKFPGCPKTSNEVQKALGIKACNPRRRLSDGGGLYLLRNSGRFKRINNFLPTGGNCTAKNTPARIKPGVFCLMEIPCRLETRYVDSSRRFTWGPAGRLANAGEAR